MAEDPNLKSVPAAMRPRYQEIVAITDAVCREHLNADYAELARKAAAALARKRTSPLKQGQVKSWACGIVYALGRVNFLSDKSTEPYLRSEELCKLFGVSPATGAAKSREVWNALDLMQLHPDWCIRSMLENNPLAWFVSINGFMVDARTLPRETQEELVQMGIIPYVVEDKEGE